MGSPTNGNGHATANDVATNDAATYDAATYDAAARTDAPRHGLRRSRYANAAANDVTARHADAAASDDAAGYATAVPSTTVLATATVPRWLSLSATGNSASKYTKRLISEDNLF